MKLLACAMSAALGCVAPATAAVPVKVADAWCRAASPGAMTGACYLTLTSAADDRLVGVETKAAERAEVHDMSMAGGVMRMRKVEGGLALPAGKAVTLKPGGLHVMVIRPKQAFALGGTVPLTLKFARSAPVTLQAPVHAADPMAGMAGMHH